MHHIHLGNYIHIATYDSLTRNKQIAIYVHNYVHAIANYKQMLTVYLFNQTVCVSTRSGDEFSLQQQYLSLSSCIYAMCISSISWHGHVKP